MNENWFTLIEQPFAIIILIIGMFGVGLLQDSRQIKEALKAPKIFIVTLLMQWVVIPSLAYALFKSGWLAKGLGLGIFLFAISPAGSMSNMVTLICKGNIAISITLCLLSNLFIFILVPIYLSLTSLEGAQLEKWGILRDLLFSIVLPISIGMTLKSRLSSNRVEKLANSCIRLSKFLLLIYFVLTLASGRLNLFEFGIYPLFFMYGFSIVPFYILHLILFLMQYEWKENIAACVEVTVKNTPAAIVIANAVQSEGSTLFSIYVCSGITFIFALTHMWTQKSGWTFKPYRLR